MRDVFVVVSVIGAFALTYGFLVLCDRLGARGR